VAISPPSPSPEVARTRARTAALTRAVRNGERPASDLEAAQREHKDARTEDYIRKAVAAAPPLSDEAAHRIVALLLTGRS
jgi:hypothetical protein